MKNTFLLALILLIFQSTVGQTGYQPLVFQSPEVSFLTNEVKTPVSLSSGTVAINIPLYTLKEGGISVPISLSYDGSGVMVNSRPTWVGQNWALKAGGMITRIVKGVPDETYVEEEYVLQIGGHNHDTLRYPAGATYNMGILKNANWNSTTQIESWAKDTDIELEPDEFIFNFCGHTGKFSQNQYGQWVCTDKRYKIDWLVYHNIPLYDESVPFDTRNSNSYTYYHPYYEWYSPGCVRLRVSRIMGFCITDDTGMKYYFGSYYKDESDGMIDVNATRFREIEVTADFFSQFYEEEFSTWHLERIVSPKGDMVKFKYEFVHPTISLSSGYTMSHMSGSAKPGGWGWLFGGKVFASRYSAGPNMSGKLISPVRLSEIRTANESVLFDCSIANTLEYDYDGQVFNYLNHINEYYYDRDVHISQNIGQAPIVNLPVYFATGIRYLDFSMFKSNKLNKISVKSLDSGQTVKEYALNYEEGSNIRLRLLSITERSGTQSLPPTTFTYNTRRLPAFLAEQYDHWGYYNGKTVNTNDYVTSNYYQKREPDALYSNAEILEKITFPSGGSKTIIYEPNRYDRVVTRNASTGALSIVSSPVKIGGGLRVKQIVENDGTNNYTTTYTYSPGILNGEIQYYWGNYQGKLFNGNTYTAELFMTSSLLPVSNNSEGGSVSYSNVTESQVGNGRTEYTFSNHNNRLDENSVSIDLQKSPYTPLSSRVMERGKLLESKVYKEGGTSPVKKETYQYSILDNKMEFIPSVYLRRLSLFGNEVNAVEGAAYKIYTYPYNVTSKVEYFYDDNNRAHMNRYYWTYDSHNQTSSYTMYNNSDSHKVTYKYPYDRSYNAPYGTMMQKNMISPVIEKVVTVNDVNTERVEVNYADSPQSTSGLILPVSVRSTSYGAQTNYTFNKYDSKGRLLQATDLGAVPTCYIWGYGGDYVVAEIKNVTIDQIKNISGLSNIEHSPLTSSLSDYQDNALRTIPNASVATYKYKPLVGISEAKDASGRRILYEYDDFGRLKSTTDDKGRKTQEFEYNIKH